MKGKTVILAGGSGGLGSSVADEIARLGGIPIIGCLRNAERANDLARTILKKHAIEPHVVVGDLENQDTRDRLLDAGARSGSPYGVVTLVGHPARIPIEDATVDDLIDSMRANFVGPVLLARDFARAAGDRDGAVVFVSSMQAIGAFPGSTVYAAPKAALVHTARILAKQWRIRVNVVAPGVTTVGMAEQSVKSGKYDRFLQQNLISRLGKPEDVVRAILFFLAPDNYVTGQILTVDGGLSLKI